MDAETKTDTPRKNLFKCIVPGCLSSTITNIAKLHSFPWRDMPRAKKWIVACGCLELLGAPPKALLRLRVCDLHFSKKLKRGKNMKLWDNSAVPTLKLGNVKKSKVGKRRLRKRSKKVKKVEEKTEVETDETPEPDPIAETSTNGTNDTMPPTPIRLPRELARFVTLRDRLQKKNTARKGYDKKFSVYALNLYLSCPSAYRVLQKSLRLPSPALLARVDVGIGTRINTDFTKCFQSKMEKIDHLEKECVLCIDEVELTKKLYYAIDKDEIVGLEEIGGMLRVAPAARALVFVARGLSGAWTQPLGYFYLADDTDPRELAAPLRKLIASLQLGGANCRVRAILSALGPTFAGLERALGVSVESPYALDAVPRGRICFLYDPEQLALTLRDTLIAYDIKFRDADGERSLRASWCDIEALHRADCARASRSLPELTRARVRPAPRESLRVQHAAAVFSRRVAAALDAAGARGSARLVRLVAEALRALRAPRGCELARVTRALDALSVALGDMRIVSADGEEHDAEVFVRSLQVSLAGALQLLGERAREAPHARLRFARFGLRPLRSFIERAEGARGRIAPQAFRKSFRGWAMRRLLAPVSTTLRLTRADDLSGLLWKVEDESLARLDGGARRSVAVGELEHRVDVSRSRSVARVAAALLHECRRAHGCADFVRWSRDASRFERIVRSMDCAFKKMFERRTLNAVGNGALVALGACLATRLPCACFPQDTFCRLFVRFRIRAALQTYNRTLRGIAKPGSARWLFR